MIMHYRYPALVRGRAGTSKTARHLLVAMHGSSEIEAVDYSDAPLAAAVYMPWGKVNYRSHQGKLYREAIGDSIDGLTTGLDTHMALSLANACRPPAGRDIRPWPEVALTFMSNAIIMKDNFRPVRGEYLKIGDHEWESMLKLGSIGSYEHEDMEIWSDVAARYVGGLISLDGDLWIPVPEPMFAIIGHSTPMATFADATVYDGRYELPKDQPPPFGRRDGFTSIFWNPAARFHALLEVADLLDGEMGSKIGYGILPWLRKPEIFIPSAFSQDCVHKELDRAARVLVAEVHSHCKAYGLTDYVKSRLRNHNNKMRRLLAEEGLSDERGDELVPQMKMVESWFSTIQKEKPQFRGADELISLVTDANAMWANREISLDVSWTQPSAPSL
jgi:hypothetical protein